MNQAVQRQASTGAPERCSWWPYSSTKSGSSIYYLYYYTSGGNNTWALSLRVFHLRQPFLRPTVSFDFCWKKGGWQGGGCFLLLHGWRWLVFTMDILDVAHFEERVKSSWPLMRLWLSPRPWGLQLLAFLLTRSPQRADLWGVCSIRGMQWEDYAYEERSRCITCPCPFGRERGRSKENAEQWS